MYSHSISTYWLTKIIHTYFIRYIKEHGEEEK